MTSVAPPTAIAAATPKRSYARLVEQTWIWSIVGYSLVRFFIAWGAFSEHGANIWIFGLIDVGTAWPYGKSVAVVCKRAARSEWTKLPVPLAVALTTFFAPYAYLWFAAGEMPSGVRTGMAICVTVLLVAASAGVFTKTRKLRHEVREDQVGDQLVIDVRTTVAHASSADQTPADFEEVVEIVDVRAPRPEVDIVIDLTSDEVTIDRSIIHG